MVDPLTRARMMHRALFAAIALLTLFIRLLPLSPGTSGYIGPDLVLAMSLAWLLRRPDFLPAWLIVLVTVVEDLFFLRPLGLWPLIVLLTTEFLRKRESEMRGLPFYVEMLIVGGVLLGMVAVKHFLLFLTVTPQPPFGRELVHALATWAVYPLVVGVSAVLLGLNRPAPGQFDKFGQRL